MAMVGNGVVAVKSNRSRVGLGTFGEGWSSVLSCGGVVGIANGSSSQSMLWLGCGLVTVSLLRSAKGSKKSFCCCGGCCWTCCCCCCCC